MKMSTKGRYGLKAMIDLAVSSREKKCVSLKSIAERQEISEAYLEQLAVSLKKNNLIKSIRGAQGGYILAKNAEDISVGDILRALEGSLELVDCVSDERSCTNKNCDKCVTKDVWAKISSSITETADSITLSELADSFADINNII